MGSFGFVVAGKEKTSGKILALKIVDNNSINTIHSLRNEADLLMQLPRHQHIIGFHHVS